MTERPIRYIPRWLHYQANIEADTSGWLFTEIPPNVFANETIWPYRLETLTLSGLTPIAAGVPLGDYGQFWGGLGSCVNLELGISGVSDINQVVAVAGVLMSHKKRYIKGPVEAVGAQRVGGYTDDMLYTRFKHPYVLARGNGFSVMFKNSRDDFQYDGLTVYAGTPAFVAHGYGMTTNNPMMLAGCYRKSDEPGVVPVIGGGGGVTFSGADLVNDGKEDVMITGIGMTFPNSESNVAHTLDSLGGGLLSLYGLYSNYLINPINGPKWMPGADTIPLMSICPLDFPWPLVPAATMMPLIQLPAVYEFPNDAKLLRRQRLSARMSNHALAAPGVTLPTKVNVTLFGYLEVR